MTNVLTITVAALPDDQVEEDHDCSPCHRSGRLIRSSSAMSAPGTQALQGILRRRFGLYPLASQDGANGFRLGDGFAAGKKHHEESIQECEWYRSPDGKLRSSTPPLEY
jgi:hypothetical protein